MNGYGFSGRPRFWKSLDSMSNNWLQDCYGFSSTSTKLTIMLEVADFSRFPLSVLYIVQLKNVHRPDESSGVPKRIS